MTFTCPRCGYSTKFQSNYKKHIYLKNICVAKNNDATIDDMIKELNKSKKENTYECVFCQKMYSTKRTLNAHIKLVHEHKDLIKKVELLENDMKIFKAIYW